MYECMYYYNYNKTYIHGITLLCKFYLIMLYPSVKNLIKTNYKNLKIHFT
jgi:hypothetical protein